MDEKSTATAQSSVETLAADAGMLALGTLNEVQYADAHLLHTPHWAEHPAERWARAIMEEVPAEIAEHLERAWRSIGLQREISGTPGTVAGWPIAHVSTEYVLLQAQSNLGFDGQLLIRSADPGVLVATFVDYHDLDGQALWERVVPGHLNFVRTLLEHRAAHLDTL